jgi:hypothetical protein
MKDVPASTGSQPPPKQKNAIPHKQATDFFLARQKKIKTWTWRFTYNPRMSVISSRKDPNRSH